MGAAQAMRTCAQTGSIVFEVTNLRSGRSVAARVHVAGTSADRRKGLLGVERMDEGSGLWIAPCEAVHTFGMKMPIDVVFLDRKLKVKKVRKAMAPGRVAICLTGSSVLEMAAGSAERSDTRVGDCFSIEPVGSTTKLARDTE